LHPLSFIEVDCGNPTVLDTSSANHWTQRVRIKKPSWQKLPISIKSSRPFQYTLPCCLL